MAVMNANVSYACGRARRCCCRSVNCPESYPFHISRACESVDECLVSDKCVSTVLTPDTACHRAISAPCETHSPQTASANTYLWHPSLWVWLCVCTLPLKNWESQRHLYVFVRNSNSKVIKNTVQNTKWYKNSAAESMRCNFIWMLINWQLECRCCQ